MRKRRGPAVTTAVFVLLGALVGAGGYLYGRENGESGSAAVPAGAVPTDHVPDANQVPTPGATPDTRDPLWGIPYRNEDADKPRFDQVLAGIQVGPSVKVASSGMCAQGEARYADPSLGETSPLAIRILTLPSNARLDREVAIECGGNVVAIEREYYLVPDAEAEGKIRRGEASWFDVEHGGAITVFKGYKEFPAQDSNIASERWTAGSVRGHAAAIARPILPGGFGDSAVVVWDESRRIQVVVTGLEVRLDLLLSIANEVIQE